MYKIKSWHHLFGFKEISLGQDSGNNVRIPGAENKSEFGTLTYYTRVASVLDMQKFNGYLPDVD